ncbi:MAG TPA: hypothetical protein VNO86_09300 [Candidatus Binatia bacterium]|nr:hypothetical protein [Candidatus Binatia bacterium]
MSTAVPPDFDPRRFLAGFAAAAHYRGRRNLRLHLGPGSVILPGWIRVSAEPGVGDLDLDLRLALPFDDGSVERIYAWRVGEAIGEGLLAFVLEAHRILAPGGRLRLVDRDRASLEAEVRRLTLQGVLPLDRIRALPPWAASDVVALLEGVGFTAVERPAIDESEAPDLAGLESRHGLPEAERGTWFVVEAIR